MTSAPEDPAVEERSVGRLFGVTDGVFAIAMTLLVIDVRVPDFPDDATTRTVAHALYEQMPSYLSFLISFYVIANYWRRHHREMRRVAIATPAMIRRTFLLLLAVTAMPFAASLLARHGDAAGVAATVYAAVNIVAIVALLSIRAEASRDTPSARSLRRRSTELLLDLVAYLVAVPVAFLLPRHGIETLFIALAVSGVTNRAIGHRARRRSSRT
ncbi:MAG: TMEM175 family protein [Corynebacteriales bacterium]|nr:TMEM175 family protein [Mycobacteriales bacterium]